MNAMPPTSPPRWSIETKRWAILAMVVILAGLVYYARSALAWLVIAALLAYLLQPLVNWLDSRGVPRALAAIIALFLAVGILFIIPAILFPLLVSQFVQLARSVIGASMNGLESLDYWMQESRIVSLWGFQIDMTRFIEDMARMTHMGDGTGGIYVPTVDELMGYAQQILATAWGVIGGLSGVLRSLVTRTLSLAFSIFLLFFYTFYITVDGNKLKPWARSLFKPEYLPEIDELGHRINRVWQSFFRGQLMLSLVIGTMTLIVGLLIGLPSALALAIIAGVMEAVPTIGPIIAAVPAIILALAQGSSLLPVDNFTFAMITLGAYILIQQLENALIVPRIMGSALELHPMIVLVGVVIGASFAGILGIFLAAPTLATLKVLFQYAHAKILDQDPFPHTLEEEQSLRPRGPTLWERYLAWRQRRLSSTDASDGEGQASTTT